MKATEQRKAQMREYRRTHKAEYNARQKEFYKRHPEYQKKYYGKYKSYKQKIDEAIKFIEEKQNANKMFGYIVLSADSQNKLLSILQGADKE